MTAITAAENFVDILVPATQKQINYLHKFLKQYDLPLAVPIILLADRDRMSQALRAFIQRPEWATMQYARYTDPTADQQPGSAVWIAGPDDMEHAFADSRDMHPHALSQPTVPYTPPTLPTIYTFSSSAPPLAFNNH